MESLVLNSLFGGIYAGRKVLVTGHTGFKGSWLCLWLSVMGARVAGLALAPDTQPSHWQLLTLDQVDDLRVDLRDMKSVQQALQHVQPEIVFHLAAQPLVRRSYREPLTTFETNVMGLVHLLQAVRDCDPVRGVVNATTDKVYLDQSDRSYREDDPLGGHDPYSTSKACAELVSDCYRKSFFTGINPTGVRSVTARAGNVIGGGDWSEDRLVPDCVRAATTGAPLLIRNPNAIRPWQHVLEPLSGYLRLGQGLLSGETIEGAWNFGPAGDATLPVMALAQRLRSEWPGLQIETDAEANPHEAEILQLDCSKATRELGWRPVWDAETTLRRTAQWYRRYHDRSELLTTQDLRDYVDDARAAGLTWTT